MDGDQRRADHVQRSDRNDPAALLALVRGTEGRTARALEPDGRLLFVAWGTAWLVGFLLFHASTTGGPSTRTAGMSLFALLAGAMLVTAVHVGRRTTGLRGESARLGARYGWSWVLGFGTLFAVLAGARETGLPEDTAALLWPVLSGLVVGLLYLLGGTAFADRTQYALGAWILVASAAGALAGYPAVYLVMAFAGGGGFLAAALLLHLRQRRA